MTDHVFPDFYDNSTVGVVYPLAASDYTQYPSFLTNGSTFFSITVLGHIFPGSLTNGSTVYAPVVVGIPKPDFIAGVSSAFDAKIAGSIITASPDFLVNASTAFDTDPNIELTIAFVQNVSSVFNAVPVYPRSFSIPFIESSSRINKPIVKQQPLPVVPVEPSEIGRPSSVLPKGERSTSDVNKVYKDLGIMFRPHPLTGDVTRVFDYDAITQSLKLIAKTRFFERPYSSQDTAGDVEGKLFRLGSVATLDDIREDLALAFVRYEPRIIIEQMLLTEMPEMNAVSLRVQYKVKTFEKSETFSTLLERA